MWFEEFIIDDNGDEISVDIRGNDNKAFVAVYRNGYFSRQSEMDMMQYSAFAQTISNSDNPAKEVFSYIGG